MRTAGETNIWADTVLLGRMSSADAGVVDGMVGWELVGVRVGDGTGWIEWLRLAGLDTGRSWERRRVGGWLSS